MSRTSELISVMMPVYNAGRYISESIESVLAQTYSDFELIVYDDGSTDETRRIVREYLKKDSRIRLFSSKINRGVGYSRNFILSKCKGEFLAPHDADDVMMRNRLEIQINLFRECPRADVASGNAVIINREGSRILGELGCYQYNRNGTASHRNSRNGMMKGSDRFPWGIPHCSAMFRKKAVEAVGGYDSRLLCAEDLDLFLRLWINYAKFVHENKYMYAYRKRKNSLYYSTFSRNPMHIYRFELPGIRVYFRSNSSEVIRMIRFNFLKEWKCEKTDRYPASGSLKKNEYAITVGYGLKLEQIERITQDPDLIVRWKRYGKAYLADSGNRQITFLQDADPPLTANGMFHGFFLFSLFRLLAQDSRVLFHGSFCHSRDAGVLVAGTGGAGKSSLMLMLLKTGYAYFSDECPVLSAESGSVSALPFYNKICLKPHSLKPFSGYTGKFKFSADFKKCFTDPVFFSGKKADAKFRVGYLIFPVYDGKKPMTIKPLSGKKALELLKQDDYYRTYENKNSLSARSHLKIFKEMIRQAKIFSVIYNEENLFRFPEKFNEAISRIRQVVKK